jgi:hypothetical protein
MLRECPANTHITADQHNTLVEEASIVYERKSHRDVARVMQMDLLDAKHSEPSASEGPPLPKSLADFL